MTSDSQLPHELVASLVLAAHAALPQSFQPAPTPTGPTWTPLAGVVLLPPPPPPTVAAAGTRPTLDAVVISIGTGSKVLPEARKSVHGDLVVDMHAETLAIRGARHWLADELVRCATVDGLAGWLEPASGEEASSPARWRLRAGVEVWLYASDIPCTFQVALECCLEVKLTPPRLPCPWAATRYRRRGFDGIPSPPTAPT
jgi:tRNA-specific adenosine deaminase 1